MGGTTCDNASSGLGLTVLSVAQIDGLLTVTNTTTITTIRIAIPNAAGPYHFKAWLSDSATSPTESTTVPDVSGVTSWDEVTDSSGGATLTIEHDGSQHTWYLWIYFNRINISGAATAGV